MFGRQDGIGKDTIWNTSPTAFEGLQNADRRYLRSPEKLYNEYFRPRVLNRPSNKEDSNIRTKNINLDYNSHTNIIKENPSRLPRGALTKPLQRLWEHIGKILKKKNNLIETKRSLFLNLELPESLLEICHFFLICMLFLLSNGDSPVALLRMCVRLFLLAPFSLRKSTPLLSWVIWVINIIVQSNGK